ncbi:amino acid-binding protein [Acuticoccus sp. M5D2P5]|uniref:ABC transporter substrate-binding protein n=1 Tax=Acuticoccus kalidii TaxID=2910977 RepID=UPI001F2F209C|nr:glycine betaine ABC transporter substrate-binding protein [Acuticoccus kalidii]MCF3932725.1 amino acid-binding protein [Acuticoccus kalidii]
MLTVVRALMIAGATAVAAPAMASTIVVGVPNWPSAEVTANIIAQILGSRYDVDTRLRPIGSVEMFDAIDRGEVDVHPEVWLPNLQTFVDEYVDKRGTIELSPIGVRAEQKLCTTRETAEATGLKAVSDLAKPEMAANFDTDGDGRGEMWIGDRTWSSTRIERVRAKSYGYDESMLLLTMPEDMAMAGLDAAIATGQPTVFYCYSPHYMFALHDIVTLEEPEHDPSNWSIVRTEEDPAWLAKSEAASAWEPSHFHVAHAAELDSSFPDIVAFLNKIALTADEAAQMSYAIHVERRDPADVASAWVDDNQARIEEWTK